CAVRTLYSLVTTADNQSFVATLHTAIMNAFSNDIKSMETAISQKILKSVNSRTNTYDRYSDMLAGISNDLSSNKLKIVSEKDAVMEGKKMQKRSYVFEVVSIILVFATIGCAILYSVSSVSNFTKDLVAVILLGVILLNILIYKWLYHRIVLETFVDADSNPQNTLNGYYITALLNANDYIYNLQLLYHGLRSNQVMGRALKAVSKEMIYFRDTTSQSSLTAMQLEDIGKMDDLTKHSSRMRIWFFTLLSLVILCACVGYYKTGAYPILRKGTFVTGVVAVFVLLLVLIAGLTSLVRTDGDKYYWYRPNMKA
ncbi:hypothetical protein EBT25_16360, partial [bacterium]|nr:hypothetical protein [bacterium]